MLDAGAKVIDLSGAFRLRDAATYARWYKEEHTAPALLAEAVYGLPEFCRERIRAARLHRQSRLLSHRRESRHSAA